MCVPTPIAILNQSHQSEPEFLNPYEAVQTVIPAVLQKLRQDRAR